MSITVFLTSSIGYQSLAHAALFKYPNKPITLIIGAQKDTQDALPLTTPIAAAIEKNIPVPAISFTPGTGGANALNTLAGATADGYTIAQTFFPAYLIQPDRPDAIYTAKDITCVAILAEVPLALWVPADSSYASLQELIDIIRIQPAGTVYLAGTGSHTGQHLASLMLNQLAGLTTIYIPYLSSADCIQSVKSQTAIATWGYALKPETMPGMRPLAVTTLEPASALSDIPTFQQSNINIVLQQYVGISLPGTADANTCFTVSQYITTLFKMPVLAEALAATGYTPYTVSFENIPKFVQTQREFFAPLINEYFDAN